MKVAVFGLWHLGSVTAACLARAGHEVVGLDRDVRVVQALRRGETPVHEPGLAECIESGMQSGRLRFTEDPAEALANSELLWVTLDTPVNDRDEGDVAWVRRELDAIRDAIRPGALVLISAQVPVGFTRGLENDWAGRGLRLAYSPENLRLGRALESFERAERVVVGARPGEDRVLLASLLGGFAGHIEWMSIESAEMTKHTLNSFLASSVAFINEVARLCETVGADAKEVERGLKSDGRIGSRAYLGPGAAFAGGTLARDVRFLSALGQRGALATPLIDGVLASNELHTRWMRDKVRGLLVDVSAPVATVLGLTYKPGTSTLRRSAAVELCAWLEGRGVQVRAHDPMVTALPGDVGVRIHLYRTPPEALAGADVAIVATPWPEYRELSAEEFLRSMRRPRVVDEGWFVADRLAGDRRITYIAPGRTPGSWTQAGGEAWS
jgi:UDPglucose 6-dehydrogenase